MLRCSDTACGQKGPGKFCQHCGGKMIHREDTVVLCGGKLDDGTPCNSKLTSMQKFCMTCGAHVDPGLFASLQESCSNCGAALASDIAFCPSCGTKKITSAASNSNHNLLHPLENSQNVQTVRQDNGDAVITKSSAGTEKQDKAAPVHINSSAGTETQDKGDAVLKNSSAGVERHDKGASVLVHSSGATEKQDKAAPVHINSSAGTETQDKVDAVLKNSSACAERQDKGDSVLVHSSGATEKQDKGNTVLTNSSRLTETQDQGVKDITNKTVTCKETVKDVPQPVNQSQTQKDVSSDSRMETPKKKSVDVLPVLSQKLDAVNLEASSQGSVGLVEKPGNLAIYYSSMATITEGVNNDNSEDAVPESRHIKDQQNQSKTKNNNKNIKTDISKGDIKPEAKLENINTSTCSREIIVKTVHKNDTKDADKESKHSKVHQNQSEIVKYNKIVETKLSVEQVDTSRMHPLSDTHNTDKRPEELSAKSQCAAGHNETKSGQSETIVQNIPTQQFVFGGASNLTSTQADQQSPEPSYAEDNLFSTSNVGNQDDGNNNKSMIAIENKQTRAEDNAAKKDEEEKEEDDGDQVEQGKEADAASQDSKNLKRQQKKSLKKKEKQRKENEAKDTSTIPSSKRDNVNQKGNKNVGDGRMVRVYFHALLSKDFNFDPKKQHVALVFEKPELGGGWKDYNRKCKVKRQIEDFYELEYDMMVPAKYITGGSQLVYKYAVGKEGKYNFEHYLKNELTGIGVNRRLSLTEKWTSHQEWHQYEGFLEKEPSWYKHIKSYILDYKKDLVKHAKKTVQIFCTSLLSEEGSSFIVHDIMEHLEVVMTCIKRIYYHDAKCWETEEQFKTEISCCVLEVLLDHVCCKKKNDGAIETSEETEARVAQSLTIIRVAKKFNFPEITSKWQIFVKNLNLRPSGMQCSELKIAEKYYPEKKRKEIKDAFVSLAQQIAKSTKDPSWLYLMPWIHFLSDSFQPFEEPKFEVGHDNVEPLWWGIQSIGADVIGYFKGKSGKWAIPIEDVLNDIEPLFEMDYLLPRTFMTALELKDLSNVIKMRKVPVEVIIANVIFHLRSTKPRSHYGNPVTSDEKSAHESVLELLKCLETGAYIHRLHCHQWQMAYTFSSDLLKECMQIGFSPTVGYSVGILLLCSSAFEDMMKETKSNTKDLNNLKSLLNRCARDATKFGAEKNYDWYKNMESILQVWNGLFAPDSIKAGLVLTEWNQEMLIALKDTLKNKVYRDKTLMTEFVRLYCRNVDKYKSSLQECLGEVAFRAIEQGYELAYDNFNIDERKRFGNLLSVLFLKEWDKFVPKAENQQEFEMILKFCLTWPPFLQFLTIYSKEMAKMELLSPECAEKLVVAVSIIESVVISLVDGTISIGNLYLLQSVGDKFSELAILSKLDKDFTKELVLKTINVRVREVKCFEEQARQMTVLTCLSIHLENVDREVADSVLKKLDTIKKHTVKEFCNPVKVDNELDIKTFQPRLCAFKVSPAVLHMLPELEKYNESSTFACIWETQCKTAKNNCDTLDDVVEEVFLPAKKSLETFAEHIHTGDIKFRDFEKFVGQRYKDDYDLLQTELITINIEDSVIVKRISQIKNYRQLERCVIGARAILQFATEFDMKNDDFAQIRVIASHGESDMEMKSFDKSIMKACEFLKELTEQRAECLQTFVACRPLILWLKESMKKSGLKELKVFVDLAFMSAGEEPINIARVQCLHSAVTGYAPLIFEMKPEAGYQELLRLCSIVWKELAANPNLPQQLRDTNRQLQWLTEIKKAHGSVEVTSLMQAEAINSNGIYTVGKNAWRKDRKKEDLHMTLEDSVKLTVPEQEGKHQQRNYMFTQLQDLQSRLMLVAGKAEKGSDTVNRFTMIFDGVIRLSNVLVKLCSSGCVLYKDWTARFMCYPNPDRPVCAILEFGQGDDAPKLKGRRSEAEDLQDIIPALARFMEKCLDDWLSHIKEIRKTYYHLNYFTIDQLVILQCELVKMGTDKQPSHLIYPLLFAVKQNCTPDDLLQAMMDAKSAINSIHEKEDLEVGDTGALETNMNVEQTDDQKKKEFVLALVEVGYDERLAQVAYEHVNSDNIDEAIVWCMDHDEDYKLSSDLETSSDNYEDNTSHAAAAAFSGWSESAMSIQSIITSNIKALNKQSDVGVLPLISDLKTLWKQFLESISSNIQDYLSLGHLGLILKCLAAKDTSEIDRILPPCFIEGQPNLIICPSADVLNTALSIYFMGKNQPLPSSEEVLMCCRTTTKDEVDIFWRRAIFDQRKNIYCLVHADLLDFDVSDAAARCLEEYLREVTYHKLKYRLIVICGSDNEYRSTIVSSLDKFKRQALPVKEDALRDYVCSQLVAVQSPGNKIKPAAEVDHEKLTVRTVKSWRSGVGKTLYKTRKEEALAGLNRQLDITKCVVSIPLQERQIDMHYVMQRLLEHTTHPGEVTARLFHLDISHEVQDGVDYLLFNLLILGCLMDSTGYVWRKSPLDLYLIETMPLMIQSVNRRTTELHYVHQMLNILPDLTCRSPQESLDIYKGRMYKDSKQSDQLFDDQQFRNPVFQRPFQYLIRLDQGKPLADVQPKIAEQTPQICLQILLKHCGVQDPSWAELHHFVWFLNTQLVDFERNNFVSAAAAEDLPGFSTFVLRFLIQMSRDFSTRSLNISEESPGFKHDAEDVDDEEEDEGNNILEVYQMRRTWESSPHPYLFFNSDRFTFTFLGFFIDRATGNLIDQQTTTVLEKAIMAQNLYDSLVRNHANMTENFDALPRDQKILKLCNVMGIDMPHDPDDTYELTTDNVKKIMAIYMRFRCDIPVIVMGETGCGKTRLVKFMCALQSSPGLDVENMILMKVHGGTTNKDIIAKVKEAEQTAKTNLQKFGKHMYTVLFFDEANSTESIGLIKEIMCDKSMEGKKLKLCENLKIVAACNPYRKHSEELIKKLEQAGLGYHVDADETTDKLGRVPMRRLVYRVQPLPQSLLPLVWDFGQLNIEVEDLYIRQMVRRYIRDNKLPDIQDLIEVVSAVLTASQEYMRKQKDECSFVSLRDVDRVLYVMSWFYMRNNEKRTLFDMMDRELNIDEEEPLSEDDFEESEEADITERTTNEITRSLILALGVCYHACLKTRKEYREYIVPFFREPCQLQNGAEQIAAEIECCQDVFLDSVELQKNIAKNMALKENLFMMAVCIELRIPLFLVGKPGSSKSLAKTIVSDAMQGNASRKDLFKELKQAQMVSFQCSPLSTPDGIVGTFRQCAQFQKDKDLDTFVSVVVLDEVGLAEDSPRMPLKTLHPLLEDGCQGDEKPEKYMKVAFIGISNWALDPAKMNRGILVQREVPDLEELINSAKGICSTKNKLTHLMDPLIKPMAESYLEIFVNASKSMREFFGLRDFYSLVKMVYGFVEKSQRKPTWHQMLHAIKRNFGGLDKVDPVESFKKKLFKVVHFDEKPKPEDPDSTASGLIQACLFDKNKKNSESRYLLLLTENYGTLTIIQQQILSKGSQIRPITIFGSSFRSDQEYTQVCRNINKIKVCMETGNTVVLLNLENLYESLYDALNQYYVYFGGERYVDLGLGTHRVKCPVHRNFRLIVVAEKQTVYKKFPIPLINRLEKHFLTINTMLSPEQQKLVRRLEKWADDFASPRTVQKLPGQEKSPATKVRDVFIGYHDDTCSAIVLHVWSTLTNGALDQEQQLLQTAQETLLWCATPDAIVRLEKSHLAIEEQKHFAKCYFTMQAHNSLVEYLHFKILKEECSQLLAQVTTHSKLLASVHRSEIEKATGISMDRILLLETLSSFDTEQQFSNKIQEHLQSVGKDPSIILIQCDSGDVNANLIASARYCVMDEYEKLREELQAPVHVVFIVQLPRIAGGCFTGFQCGVWHSVHIDDLYTADEFTLKLEEMHDKSPAELFGAAIGIEIDKDIQARADEEDMECEPTNAVRESTVGARVESSAGVFDTAEHYHAFANREVFNQGNTFRNETELDVNDVFMEIEAMVRRGQYIGTQFSQHGKSKVEGLILYCVQAALSMVKDKCEDKSRETDRVALVLRLLHEDNTEGHLSFICGIAKLITKLLKEKENSMYRVYAKHWLVEEAAKNDNITKAGTFRRACVQTLASKVSPILAGIIAYLDTNRNLDILQDLKSPWKQNLWLALVNYPDTIQLRYTDLQSPARQSDLKEVLVTTTGYEGHYFCTRMPFSWIMQDMISEIMKNHPPNTEHIEAENKQLYTIETWVRLLKETNLGKCVDALDGASAILDYIHDFVHTVYNAGTETEHMLVSKTISHLMSKISEGIQQCSLLHMLISVHLAYKALAPRLTYFHAMNVVWPKCSDKIVELKEEMPDHFMFQEQEFTFSALCLLIEHLTPDRNELNEPNKRTKWLKKVHSYRPVVEKIFGLLAEDPNVYGVHSFKSCQKARFLWSRVVVMKLFLENVCNTDEDTKITIKHCMPLWTLLGDNVDMKEMRSLGAVEKFLKSCNRSALKEFLGSEQKCENCEKILEGPPITLPCKDILCDSCYNEMSALKDEICPKCRTAIDKGWNPDRQIANRKDIEKMKNYQKRCNAFFMDIVSQLCFVDNTAPSDEVMEKLLSYITCSTTSILQTKDLTIFETGLDPNPIFRSFLLQLLMRTSEETVKENLARYLKQAEVFIKQGQHDQDKQYVELSLLVIQCLEDIFNQDSLKSNEILYGIQALQRAHHLFDGNDLTVEKMYGLASARTGLAIAAKYIANIVSKVDDIRTVDPNVKKLIEAASVLCENVKSKWPRVFLVKYMCRRFGIDVYGEICRRQTQLKWMIVCDVKTDAQIEGPDRFIVCGDVYIQLREAITKVVLGEDTDSLMKSVEKLQTAQRHVEQLLHLAVFREITLSYLYNQQKRKLNDEVSKIFLTAHLLLKILQKLVKFVNESKFVRNKNLLLMMIQNQLAPMGLAVVENEPIQQQGIQCLLVHLLCVMSTLRVERTLLHPLLALINQPQAYVNVFLPTMPQDDLSDVKQAVMAASHGETPTFYRCPNGHPYLIGNCGRPVVDAVCRDCGAPIGGARYVLSQGSTLDPGTDQTQTGHILGQANARGIGALSERNLTPAYCACVRVILHMAMYLGCSNHRQVIHSMIKPMIDVTGVDQYIYLHIQRDLEDAQKAIGRSVDDVLLLMHTVVDNIMRKHHEGETVAVETSNWTTKNGRTDWETKFSAKFVVQQLQDLDNVLKMHNQSIAQDDRLGANPLLCLLYETEGQTGQENPAMLQEIPRVWRYRTPISIDHLRQEFETQLSGQHKGIKQHKVLQLFLKEEHHLRTLKYIPSMLWLHRALLHKYYKKLDKAEASTITVVQLRKEEVAGLETPALLQDFMNAWELVRDSLKYYVCPTDIGGMVVSKEFCSRNIDDQTPIAMFLPTMKEAGLCSYALLDFLFRKQNDFLDKYLKESGIKNTAITSVLPKEVTSAHLISYDPQQDILPLVLANCQYSFEIGKGTKIEYDFGNLERQLMDRFMFSKSKIDVGRVLQIDQMIYRTEVTNAEVFRKLADKIPQVALSNAVKTQITGEIRSLPDICQSLDNLDITISFIKTTGGSQQQSLHDFMLNTLRMVSSLHSRKAQQECQFKHARSLWLFLSLLKSKRMCQQNQPREVIFESVGQEFLEDLTNDIKDSFTTYMKNLSVEKLTQLVEVIHEYILLVIAVRENPDDEDYTDKTNNKLKDWLSEYIDQMDTRALDTAIMADFPAEILFKNTIHAWITAQKMLREKQTGNTGRRY